MRSTFFGNLDPAQLPGNFALQNSTMLRIRLKGDAFARPGTLVACQGQVDVTFEGAPPPAPPEPAPAKAGLGGLGRKKEAAVPSAPPAPLMRCHGQGLVFLAHRGYDVHLFYLEGEALTVNGSGLLAFDASLNWDIQPTQDAFITTVHGTGWVAVCTHGTPVLLDTGRAPTFVNAQSAVCWTTELQVGVNPNGRGGTAIQLAFQGQGFVLVEAGEDT